MPRSDNRQSLSRMPMALFRRSASPMTLQVAMASFVTFCGEICTERLPFWQDWVRSLGFDSTGRAFYGPERTRAGWHACIASSGPFVGIIWRPNCQGALWRNSSILILHHICQLANPSEDFSGSDLRTIGEWWRGVIEVHDGSFAATRGCGETTPDAGGGTVTLRASAV